MSSIPTAKEGWNVMMLPLRVERESDENVIIKRMRR